MVQVMTTVDQDVNPVVFQPIEEANITFNTNHVLAGINEGIGELKSKTFAKSVLVNNTCYIDLESTTTLNLQSHDGSPFSVHPSLISCELSSVDNSQPVTCGINEAQSGNYDIRFIPHTEGRHQLKVRLGGMDISPDSFDLFPKMRGKPLNITQGINKPWGIVANENGEIVVAENGLHCIKILNKEGEMRSFGEKGTKKGQFTNPRGIAISHDGHLLVTDDHRLQKLKFNGSCVKSVGSSEKGNGRLQFNHPRGVTVHPTTGQIFIADCSNNRITVLNDNLSYSHSFGKGGCTQEQFNRPHDVTFDNEGYLYVVDSGNHCIKKFTSTGKYVATFGSDQLKDPTSVIIQHNLIYVSESYNNRVSAFDINNGQFKHCFGKKGNGEGEFDRPQGITVASLGCLYVSDTWNNRLVVL